MMRRILLFSAFIRHSRHNNHCSNTTDSIHALGLCLYSQGSCCTPLKHLGFPNFPIMRGFSLSVPVEFVHKRAVICSFEFLPPKHSFPLNSRVFSALICRIMQSHLHYKCPPANILSRQLVESPAAMKMYLPVGHR